MAGFLLEKHMADVESDLDNWSATAGSNKPAGGTAIGTGLDDNLREIQAVTRKYLAHKGGDIASAATVDLSAATGWAVDITGTTTITAFGTLTAGRSFLLQFDGALTLTHNGTSLICPGGANITTAAGDMCLVVSEGSGNWRVAWYMPADGKPVIRDSVLTTKGDLMYHNGTAEARFTTSAGGKFLISTLSGTSTASGTLIPAWGGINGTMSGAVDGDDNTLSKVNLKDYGEVTNAIGDFGGGAQAIDIESGNVVTATVSTGAVTFTFSNPTASDEGCGFTLVLTNGGSQTVNWPASVDWAGGNAPSLTSSGVDILEFFTVDGGTTWHGFVAGLDMQ